MNNYYTLFSLACELIYKIRDKKITEILSYRKDRIDMFFDPPETGKLAFSASAPGTALFLDSHHTKPARNAVSFFPEIYGATVSGIELISPADRLIRMSFSECSEQLLFKPFGSRPNLFLIRDQIILSSFKDSTNQKGKPAPEPVTIPRKPVSGNPDPSLSESDRKSNDSSDKPDNRSVREQILAIDRQFPRGILADVIDTSIPEQCTPSELETKIEELRKLLLNPEQVCISAEGNLCLLPEHYLSHPPEQRYSSVNDAVRTLYNSQNRDRRLLPRKKELQQRISKRLNGWKKQMEQFEKKTERLEKADRFEHFANLLMSHPSPGTKTDSDKIRLSDWEQEGKEVEIPVKPGLVLLDQAEKYYERASGIRKEVEISGKKEKELTERIRTADQILQELVQIEHPSKLEQWLKTNEVAFRQLGLSSTNNKQEAIPYRQISLGIYEVWIGKNAKSNDKLLNLSHKEDIWMHARGTAGSHLILRNRGKADWPEKKFLLKAASWAAAWSKQSGSSMVPVMMAKRKHVRKPKGAPPGQVVVTNEKVEMVRPQKPDLADS